MRARVEFGFALALQIVGSAVVLLVSTRAWQTITTVRTRPFRPDVLGVTGRTIDAAPTALALVGLAGVVAVVATKGVPRRVVGVLVALAGAATIWRSALALGTLSPGAADAIVRDKHEFVVNAAVAARHITTHPVYGTLSIAGGCLLLLAGSLAAWHGSHWSALSARYERPPSPAEDEERARARADATMWAALERGHDPTAESGDDPSDPR
jgi:uncharacterized membrane protein (TIGR02234 family)